jgi:hypothetical protein
VRGAILVIGPDSRVKLRDWLATSALKDPRGDIKLTITDHEQKLEGPKMETLDLEVLLDHGA